MTGFPLFPSTLQPNSPDILLVDDDPIQKKLAALRLRAEGFKVRTASSAEEALRSARERPPDAIVSDIVMGDLDGFGFCQRARQDPLLASVPIVLLSAHYCGDRDRELARRMGASALVARTSTFDDELRALRHSLDAPPPHDPAAPPLELIEDHLQAANRQLATAASRARRSEQRYRALFDAAPDVVAVLTPEGIVVDVNKRAETILGSKRDELIGRRFPALTSTGACSDAVDRPASRGPASCVTRFERPNGSTVHLELSGQRVEIDGEPIILTIARDITEFVATAQALVSEQHKVRAVVERIRDVVWSTDGDRRITFITANVFDVLGITPEQIYAGGSEILESRIHPDDRAPVMAATQTAFETSHALDIEFRWLRSPDRWIRVRSRISILENEGQRRAEGLLSDVTEQRALEESLRQAQKMDAIGRLTAGLAHDFNNVLGAILAHAHFLLENLSDADPRRPDADEIRLSAERGSALVRQLLTFSRRQVLAPRALDLNTTLASLERMLRRLIGEDVDLRLILSPQVGTVWADAGQLEQVIMNLVVNARDAMPTGGSLTLETAELTKEQVRKVAPDPIPPGRYIQLKVSDTGCGMTPEVQSHAFEPFFTTKERGSGTGLGLSTCYGIVKQSGGYMSLSSAPGRGTTVSVCLPITEVPPPQSPAPPTSTTASALRGDETVLLVEDDALVRKALCRTLASHGYTVLAARDSRDAVKVARERGPDIDLVVCDVVMPGTSGIETVRQIRAHASRAKVLFTSGYIEHAILDEGNLSGRANFLPKPFAPDVLALKARQILDG